MYVRIILFGFVISLLFNSNLFSYDRYSISESIGDYHAGCVKKSIELPNGGSGYQIIRPSRKRYYGNQITIDYIRKLSRKFNKKYKSNILIADISKKGGGPIPYEHSSHQTGLDADILLFHKENYIELYTREEREELEPNSVLDETKKKIDFSKWEELNGELLKTAANYSEVNRIFINPAIKKHLCNRYENESWLKKLRPWWGHDGHFHVRLKCPDNNHKCVDQKNPGHIECGEELDFWLSDEAFAKRKRERAKPRRKKALRLPPECR